MSIILSVNRKVYAETFMRVTFCVLQTYSSLQEVLVSFGRRVLCYPLYRNFVLVTSAIRDTAKILQAGESLKSLHTHTHTHKIQIEDAFRSSHSDHIQRWSGTHLSTLV